MSYVSYKGKNFSIENKELKIHNQRIENFNEIEGLGDVTDLEVLDLYKNEITEIKGLNKLTKLKTLILSSNKISNLENFDNLINLESLVLNDNEITKIENLNKLEKLRSLSLANNKISKIKNIDTVTTIEQLNLSGNNITKIKGLNRLDRLSELDLSNNKIDIIEGLEDLKNLKVIYLDGNKLKPPDDIHSQVFTSGVQIVHYCRRKKRGEIEHTGLYSDEKTHSEKIIIYKRELKALDTIEFINIGTHNEKENTSWKQNRIFYERKPYIKHLSDVDFTIEKININLVQLHSLKGINFLLEKDNPNYNNAYFDFFINHFWDYNEIEKNVLVYKNYIDRVSNKIDEFLELCVKNHKNKESPHMLVFPENSIPQKKINSLISFSVENQMIIIGGIEHLSMEDEDYNNIAFIIDKGAIGYQLKQTPIAKKNLVTGEYNFERILCQTIPRINIFETSIGNIAIFVCKDFLRLSDIISDWAWKNDIDFIVVPSLTSKVLPFHYKLLNIFNYTDYQDLKVIFNNIGEYGGSEFFTLKTVKTIEEEFRKNIRDNVGEVIVSRKYEISSEISS